MGENMAKDEHSTAGKVISCRAAVAWNSREKLSIEQISVAPPEAGEVRVRIVYTTICHSDLFVLRSKAMSALFPRVLGHEAVGIVESVGAGVTDLKPGDHVLPLFTGECKECAHCKSNKTNMCEVCSVAPGRGTMRDNSSRFSLNGQVVFHGLSSTFSEYTVVERGYVVKINPEAPMDTVFLLSCGAATGMGSVWNVAKVEAGATVAIFGLGTVGMGVAQGARVAGASRIIGVDILSSKSEAGNAHRGLLPRANVGGKQFGLTDFLNPKDFEKPIEQVITEMTDGGVDYAFECIGSPKLMKVAFDSCRSWGVTVVVGVTPPGVTMEVEPSVLIRGKSLVGSMYGGWRPQSDIPELVEKYLRNVR